MRSKTQHSPKHQESQHVSKHRFFIASGSLSSVTLSAHRATNKEVISFNIWIESVIKTKE